MTIHHCSVEYPATREDPGYGCEEEVENEGDLCAKHDGCSGCSSRYCEDCNG